MRRELVQRGGEDGLLAFAGSRATLSLGRAYSLFGDKIVRSAVGIIVGYLPDFARLFVDLDALDEALVPEFEEDVLDVRVAESDVPRGYQAAIDFLRSERDLVPHQELKYHVPAVLLDHVVRFIWYNNITFGCISTLIALRLQLHRVMYSYKGKDISPLPSETIKHGSHERIGASPKGCAERVLARSTLLGVSDETMQPKRPDPHKADESFDSLVDCKHQNTPAQRRTSQTAGRRRHVDLQ